MRYRKGSIVKKTTLLLLGFLGSNLSVIASDSPHNRLSVPKASRKDAGSPGAVESPKPTHAPKTERLSDEDRAKKIKRQSDSFEHPITSPPSSSAAPAARCRAFIAKRVSPARRDTKDEKLDITLNKNS